LTGRLSMMDQIIIVRIDLREGAELSNYVPKRVLRYYKHSSPLPDYHEATKIPDIVQDRYNDDIHQDICCS
jgi:hypothetical protein